MIKDLHVHPLFTIIIPSKNEEEDIADTLEACINIDYPNKEIIVVDDSSDNTPNIVSRYSDKGVRLIHREKNSNGCCGARNRGMQEAKGEFVVLVNGDDRPKPDFLFRILEHYQNGADFVIVRSFVLNSDQIWGRFTNAHGLSLEKKDEDILWCEGFSCRESAAKNVGYIPGDFPVPFCRDWMFGKALEENKFKKIIDMSLTMEHLWPATLKGYFKNQVHRGTHSSPSSFYFRKMSVKYLFIRETLKAIRSLLRYLLIFPSLYRSIRIAKYSPRGFRDIPAMYCAGLVNDIATVVGNYKGWFRLYKSEGFK